MGQAFHRCYRSRYCHIYDKSEVSPLRRHQNCLAVVCMCSLNHPTASSIRANAKTGHLSLSVSEVNNKLTYTQNNDHEVYK